MSAPREKQIRESGERSSTQNDGHLEKAATRGRSASLGQVPGNASISGPFLQRWYTYHMTPTMEEPAVIPLTSRAPLIKRPSTSSGKHMSQKQRPLKPERALTEPFDLGEQLEVRQLAVQEPFRLCNLSDYSVLPTGPLLHHNPLASVYISRTLKHQYVIKQVVKKNTESVESLLHEATILTHLSIQPNYRTFVVGFHGIDMGISHAVLPALVFEKMECSLQDWLKRNLSTNTNKRSHQLQLILGSFTIQMTAALRWLHNEATVIHGDIKPSNILIRTHNALNASGSLALCFADFASACIIDQPSPAHTGLTYSYMAPEKLRKPQDPPTLAGDVWALAITMLEMVAGREPYGDINSRMKRLAAIGHGEPLAYVRDEVEETGYLEYVQDVLGPALKKDPAKRVTARDWPAIVCNHFVPIKE